MSAGDHQSTISTSLATRGDLSEPWGLIDWRSTAIGDRAQWSDALQHAFAFLLTSDLPSALLWSPDRAVLYNDAWIPAMGHRHPEALGQPAHAVWTAVWGRVASQLDAVVEKGALLLLSDSEFPVRLDREKPWAFSLSPVRGAAGEVSGILVQGQEVHPSAIARSIAYHIRS